MVRLWRRLGSAAEYLSQSLLGGCTMLIMLYCIYWGHRISHTVSIFLEGIAVLKNQSGNEWGWDGIRRSMAYLDPTKMATRRITSWIWSRGYFPGCQKRGRCNETRYRPLMQNSKLPLQTSNILEMERHVCFQSLIGGPGPNHQHLTPLDRLSVPRLRCSNLPFCWS